MGYKEAMDLLIPKKHLYTVLGSSPFSPVKCNLCGEIIRAKLGTSTLSFQFGHTLKHAKKMGLEHLNTEEFEKELMMRGLIR